MALSRYLPAARGAVAVLGLGCTAAQAADTGPTAVTSVRHDVSAPMRDLLRNLPPEPALGTEEEPYLIPNILLKPINRFDHSSVFVRDYSGMQRQRMNTPAPVVSGSFDGINQATSGCGCMPPDTNGDVSDQHYIQWVNSSWQAFNKTTGVPDPQTPAPVRGNSFFVGFGGKCETTNSGDPIALWDPRAQRWVMSQFVTSAPFAQCVAVSTTSDPFGTYNRYEFNFPLFGDYPHMGVWTDESTGQDAYLLTTHEFNSASAFQGASLIAFERDKMLTGATAKMIRSPGYDAYGVEPVNIMGTLDAPANACPSFVHYDGDTSDYVFWDMCLNWPAGTALITPKNNPIRVAGNPFVPYFDNVPQQGTANGLNSFGTHIMYRANARVFPADAPTRVSLVVNHVVQGDVQQGAINWVHFNLDNGGTAPATPAGLTKKIVDQGIFAPDSTNRWMGGIAIDGSANIGVGYSKSDSTMHPQIEISGRTLDDPMGTLRDEQSCTDGVANGSQTSSSSRWGDYSSMSVDPVDQCTFYFTSEYYATTAASAWRTRVCSFKFDNCGAPNYALVANSPQRVEMCSATQTTDPSYALRVGVLNGFNGVVTLGGNGLPAGSTAQFSPASVTGAGTSTLTLSGGHALPSGEYSFTATGTSGALTRDIALELGLSDAAPVSVQLAAPVDSAAGVKNHPLLSWGPLPDNSDRIFGDGFDGTSLPPIPGPPTDALSYKVEVAKDAGFATIVASKIVPTTSWTVDVALDATTQYWWRVTPQNHCGDGPTSETFTFTTGVPGECPAGTTRTTLFQDNMESGVNGWTLTGTGGTAWAQKPATTGTGLTGTVWSVQNNTVTSDRGLVSPAVNVPANAQATFLSYDTYHRFEDNGPGSCWDNATLDATVDGGAFNYLDGTRMLTDPYDGIASPGETNAGAASWCHAPAGTLPIHAVVDLDGFEGKSLQVRFRAVSDSNTAAPAPNGFHVDNVKIDVCQ